METTDPRSITDILQRLAADSDAGLRELAPVVFDELHAMAERYFAREAADHTLQPTALVNEVYLRLVQRHAEPFRDRSEFFAFSARLMRQILVDHARSRKAAKRGGGVKILLDPDLEPPAGGDPDPVAVLALDEALARLAELSEQQHRIVELRWFGGLTLTEVADALGVSLSTVERGWRFARLWLSRELRHTPSDAGSP